MTSRIALATLASLALLAGCSSTPENACSSTGQALSVCAKGPTVKGVDVYEGQGTINWTSVKADGIAFGITRVSDGTAHPDTRFQTNWIDMKSAGLVRGTYQFFRPEVDPIAQADLLLSMLAKAGGLQSGDLPPMIDIETSGGLSASGVQASMTKWITYVEKKIGRKPMIYTAAFMSGYVGTGFSSYPLWVANYGPVCPTMPSGWADWVIWQYADHGTVAGLSGGEDMDEFNGTMQQLLDFAKGPVAPPPADAGAPVPDAGSVGTDAGAGTDAAPPVVPPAKDAGTAFDPCAP
jgi:lysozyme